MIQQNESVFIGSQLGLEYLSPYHKAILKANGIDIKKFKTLSQIDRAYYFGMMAQTLGGNQSYKVTNSQFTKWYTNQLKKPLSTSKKSALDYLKQRSFADISGLGNKITNNLTQKIAMSSLSDKKKLQKKVKKLTIKAVKDNSSVAELASILREMSQDWARDFSRISDYILQEAYGFGRAQQILEDYGDDAEVYKETFPGVCKHCEKNYGSPGEEPIVFRLDDLIANGNNIGRKEQEPIVGPAHPWARSILHVKPKGSIWNSNTKRFEIQRDTQGIKRKSKIKVIITP